MLPKYFWCRAIYWSMVSLPGVTALKKTGSLSSPEAINCPQLFSLGRVLGAPPIPC